MAKEISDVDSKTPVFPVSRSNKEIYVWVNTYDNVLISSVGFMVKIY